MPSIFRVIASLLKSRREKRRKRGRRDIVNPRSGLDRISPLRVQDRSVRGTMTNRRERRNRKSRVPVNVHDFKIGPGNEKYDTSYRLRNWGSTCCWKLFSSLSVFLKPILNSLFAALFAVRKEGLSFHILMVNPYVFCGLRERAAAFSPVPPPPLFRRPLRNDESTVGTHFSPSPALPHSFP